MSSGTEPFPRQVQPGSLATRVYTEPVGNGDEREFDMFGNIQTWDVSGKEHIYSACLIPQRFGSWESSEEYKRLLPRHQFNNLVSDKRASAKLV